LPRKHKTLSLVARTASPKQSFLKKEFCFHKRKREEGRRRERGGRGEKKEKTASGRTGSEF
jgi:hypothetical protein